MRVPVASIAYPVYTVSLPLPEGIVWTETTPAQLLTGQLRERFQYQDVTIVADLLTSAGHDVNSSLSSQKELVFLLDGISEDELISLVRSRPDAVRICNYTRVSARDRQTY